MSLLPVTLISSTFVRTGSYGDNAGAAVDWGSGTGRFAYCFGFVGTEDATGAHARPSWCRAGITSPPDVSNPTGLGGVLMTAGALGEVVPTFNRFSRLFTLDSAAINVAGAALTGTKSVRMQVTLPDGTTIDGNRKPGVWILVFQSNDLSDVTLANQAVVNELLSGSNPVSQSVGTPSANSAAFCFAYSDGTVAATATAPSTLVAAGNAGLDFCVDAVMRAGTGSPVNVQFQPGNINQSQVRHVISAASAVPSDLGGTVGLGDVGIGGGASGGGGSGLSGTMAGGDVGAAGTLGIAPAVVTVPGLKSSANLGLPSELVPVVTISRMSDGAPIAQLTNQLANGSGDLVLPHGSMVVGTWYVVAGWNADGSKRFILPLQAV